MNWLEKALTSSAMDAADRLEARSAEGEMRKALEKAKVALEYIEEQAMDDDEEQCNIPILNTCDSILPIIAAALATTPSPPAVPRRTMDEARWEAERLMGSKDQDRALATTPSPAGMGAPSSRAPSSEDDGCLIAPCDGAPAKHEPIVPVPLSLAKRVERAAFYAIYGEEPPTDFTSDDTTALLALIHDCETTTPSPAGEREPWGRINRPHVYEGGLTEQQLRELPIARQVRDAALEEAAALLDKYRDECAESDRDYRPIAVAILELAAERIRALKE